MRDIKFRAWDSLGGKMYSWTELLNQNLKNIFTIPEQCGYNIMQYTGLKDKNGKEIYEGDIILTQPFRDKPYSKNYKEKRLKGIVKYNVKCGDDFCGCEGKMKYWGAEWNVEIIDKEDYKKFSNYDWGRFFECEVIDNIYDNKNLLEEGE